MTNNIYCLDSLTAEWHRLRELNDGDVVVEVEEVESRVADADGGVDGHPAVVGAVDQVAASLCDKYQIYILKVYDNACNERTSTVLVLL